MWPQQEAVNTHLRLETQYIDIEKFIKIIDRNGHIDYIDNLRQKA